MEFGVTRNDKKCCWSWHAWIINLKFLQLYLLHFPFKVSIDSFLLEADFSFLKDMKIIFYIELGVIDWPTVAEVLLVLNYLDIPTRPSWEPFWICLSRCKLAVTSFSMFLWWNKFWLLPLDWYFDKLNMQKGSINVLSMSTFKLIKFLKQSAWVFSTKSPSRCFWSSLSYVQKWFVVCSTSFLSATLTENFTVRLCLLLILFSTESFNRQLQLTGTL